MTANERLKMLEAMIADEPKDPELRYAHAMEYASAGDDAAAVRWFQELIQIAPDFAPAYHQAARTLQRLNRLAEARALLAQGVPVAEKQGNYHAAGEMTELLQSFDS